MSTDWQEDVAEFMRGMGQEVRTVPIGEVIDIPVAEERLRVDLIQEELDEFMAAESITEIADAIADILYVTVGAACTYGITLQPIWDEVHRSNMAKTGGPIREDGKKLKPDGWTPPDIEKCLREQGWTGGTP